MLRSIGVSQRLVQLTACWIVVVAVVVEVRHGDDSYEHSIDLETDDWMLAQSFQDCNALNAPRKKATAESNQVCLCFVKLGDAVWATRRVDKLMSVSQSVWSVPRTRWSVRGDWAVKSRATVLASHTIFAIHPSTYLTSTSSDISRCAFDPADTLHPHNDED